MRGAFRLLDVFRIDLPRAGCERPEFCLSRLPHNVRSLFDPLQEDGILQVMLRALPGYTRHRPRLYCRPGHYGKLLDLGDQAGMITWSQVAIEDNMYTSMAERLTMTSFAVQKDVARDRMISWPRAQNDLMPEPPYCELPDPGVFARLRVSEDASLQAFYFDVQNMFHNIRLPDYLVRFFPLRTVCFGNLPGRLQKGIAASLGFRPHQAALFRPLQATFAMGFKWAVYIGHTFAGSCFRKAYATFLASDRLSFPHSCRFSHQAGIIQLSQGDGLLMHIIDDVNFVCSSWLPAEVTALHDTCFKVFTGNGLPIKISKSLPVGSIERTTMRFIGWVWNLESGVIEPS